MKRLAHLKTLTDERFIARLGVISVQNRIDAASDLNRRWTSSFRVGQRSYVIEGFAADFGRPRGVDTDVQLAVETLFQLQGCPEDNTVRTTAYELLQLSHLPNKGSNYARLRESLLRLWRVGFLVSEAQQEDGSSWITYLNETLSLYQRVRFWSRGSRDDSGSLQALVGDGALTIELSAPLAQSIRAGYTQSLNRHLLSQIEQPTGRATYRILQAHRPESGPLQVSLTDWGQACGIVATQSDKIRRTLAAAHEELQSNHYLDGVEIRGRGSAQQLVYHFRAENAADPALVALLCEVGVPRARAEQLAAQHANRVEAAVAYVRERREQGKVRSSPALVSDILMRPEKYLLGEAPSAQASAIPVDPEAEKRRAAERERREAERHEAQQRALLELSPEAQWEASRQALTVMLGRQRGLLSELEARCRSGRLGAASVLRRLIAMSPRERTAWLEGELLAPE